MFLKATVSDHALSEGGALILWEILTYTVPYRGSGHVLSKEKKVSPTQCVANQRVELFKIRAFGQIFWPLIYVSTYPHYQRYF